MTATNAEPDAGAESSTESSAASSAELSIAFSSEELAVLTATLGLPPIPGAAETSAAPDVLGAAHRSLRARGVMDASGAAIATAVIDLLRIVTAPRASVQITLTTPRTGSAGPADGRAPGGSVTRRYALTPPAGIDHAEDDGVYRFTPFAAVDVLARLADAAGLTGGSAAPDQRLPADGITAPEGALRAAADATDAEHAAAILLAAGVPSGAAAALADAIADRRRIVSVRVRRAVGPGRVEGMDAGWAVTARGLVDWPIGEEGRSGAGPWNDPDRPVTIRSVDIRELLADLAAAVTGETAENR